MAHVSPRQDDSGGGDWLTGLPDRGGCVASLAALLAAPRDGGGDVAVFWLDVDRFRQINHSFGYLVGDGVLMELARRLERLTPAGAFLARVGADEFAMLVPYTDRDEAEGLGQRLVDAVHQPLVEGSTRIRPSASVGVALARPGESGYELLERAERAMADAKYEGGGRCNLAPDTALPGRDGKSLVREELAVEEMLHRALDTGGLYHDYQPIVRTGDGVPVAAEALMRCNVDGVSIPPARFLPVAEKTGLIRYLGDWSLVSAAEFLGRLRARGMDLRVAVNVSGIQLRSAAFAKALHGVLAYTGIEPGRLELELTEALFMDTSETVQNNLRAAMAAGFPLVLDDFGTGQSSLACLKDLPASKIKLDRSFVVDLAHDRRALGIAQTVARLAADQGITVVAEGVETMEQLERLRELGVGELQGFLIARPMNEAALIDWVSAWKT